ncbi:MAG: RelA/SpoT family protein [Nanoarchaeota archaeon]
MDLLEEVKRYNPHANLELIEKALKFADKAHEGQKRATGEPYMIHCLAVAHILVDLKADSSTIAAALLHDVLEDTKVKEASLKKEFGEEIANLVDGVTKIQSLQMDKETIAAENMRKILIAMAKDIRVILIKLADRLHNMRTLSFLSKDRQLMMAKETLEVYAPIAQKLGMNLIKSELEDLCLKYLEPELYHEFENKLVNTKKTREDELAQFMAEIRTHLETAKIHAQVFGRVKNFYNIYKKIKERGVPFNEIYDLNAIRIMVDTLDDCYKSLGLIHHLFKPVPKRFKDYIAVPKSNGYQSLHTTIMAPFGRFVEVQIRTAEMHTHAEFGIAAHWMYKGVERDKKFERHLAWTKQILEWKRSSPDAKDLIESLKVDIFKDEIFVFTPKGDSIILPEHATPLDFAYGVHTDIGNHCGQAKVNGKIAPLDFELKSGDVVEILTKKEGHPSRHWLQFVKTSEAKSKIRVALGIKLKHALEHHDEKKAVIGMIEFRVWVTDRVGVLADILNIFSKEHVNLKSVYTKPAKDQVLIVLVPDLKDPAKADQLLDEIHAIRNVVQARVY